MTGAVKGKGKTGKAAAVVEADAAESTGKVNKDRLQEEIGDVLAGLTVCVDRFKLDHQFTNERAVVKGAQLREWHGLIEEKAAPVKPPEPTVAKPWWAKGLFR